MEEGPSRWFKALGIISLLSSIGAAVLTTLFAILTILGGEDIFLGEYLWVLGISVLVGGGLGGAWSLGISALSGGETVDKFPYWKAGLAGGVSALLAPFLTSLVLFSGSIPPFWELIEAFVGYLGERWWIGVLGGAAGTGLLFHSRRKDLRLTGSPKEELEALTDEIAENP